MATFMAALENKLGNFGEFGISNSKACSEEKSGDNEGPKKVVEKRARERETCCHHFFQIYV
jgi:hypothetical protein